MSERKKVGAVIISHGQLAGELLAAAEMVVGPLDHISAVSIGWHDDVDLVKDEVERAIERVSADKGVLLLTDMFGGIPTNIAAMFLGNEGIELVTGVNLPMILKLATQPEELTLVEAALQAEERGRSAIRRAGGLLSIKG